MENTTVINICSQNIFFQTTYSTIKNCSFLTSKLIDNEIKLNVDPIHIEYLLNYLRGYLLDESCMEKIGYMIDVLPNYITINVGGKYYYLDRDFLCEYLEYFKIFTEHNKHLNPDYSSVLIDRSYVMFDKILEYGQKQTNTELYDFIKQELEYYLFKKEHLINNQISSETIKQSVELSKLPISKITSSEFMKYITKKTKNGNIIYENIHKNHFYDYCNSEKLTHENTIIVIRLNESNIEQLFRNIISFKKDYCEYTKQEDITISKLLQKKIAVYDKINNLIIMDIELNDKNVIIDFNYFNCGSIYRFHPIKLLSPEKTFFKKIYKRECQTVTCRHNISMVKINIMDFIENLTSSKKKCTYIFDKIFFVISDHNVSINYVELFSTDFGCLITSEISSSKNNPNKFMIKTLQSVNKNIRFNICVDTIHRYSRNYLEIHYNLKQPINTDIDIMYKYHIIKQSY
ncbi:putative potassium channel voltage-dependent tetramerization domain protein [Niemeyer virus]|uniref:Potassium channel voltage dependent tetramerization domain protein n=1 Tax=Acanthamoeba polyphaga mimivirus Kroon TaxID=3069720 RepID=A0A0G2Y3C5_9VIRU|nr:putative potassium channel voltage dependent tetramerization domain protein [Acanthamoeba polyphaga mimivirus]AKI80273.1 putative potassium channel voltage dependent tetramerization domain protein [Acanthamoeba polyphaga mimivirus Kroon]ALR83983.1 putative potassium channel voltage-dependent tetramerization domain protein [Niemeyer virus]